MADIWSNRHPSVSHFKESFAYDHLPNNLQLVSKQFYITAVSLIAMLSDGPELSTALRKLVEAKDCAVRQAVSDSKAGR